MSMNVAEVKRWLNTLDKDAEIAVDDGGLALIEVGGDAYLEIGGTGDGDK